MFAGRLGIVRTASVASVTTVPLRCHWNAPGAAPLAAVVSVAEPPGAAACDVGCVVNTGAADVETVTVKVLEAGLPLTSVAVTVTSAVPPLSGANESVVPVIAAVTTFEAEFWTANRMSEVPAPG